MTHVLVKNKRSYTELQTVVYHASKLQNIYFILEKKLLEKVARIPLSYTKACRRLFNVKDLENKLVLQLKLELSFAIQLDETTDLSSESQLIVFCRLVDVEFKKIRVHYMFGQPLLVNVTAKAF